MSLIDQGRTFVSEVAQETKKVTWPTRTELREATLVVIASVFVISLVVGAIDLIFARILRLVIK